MTTTNTTPETQPLAEDEYYVVNGRTFSNIEAALRVSSWYMGEYRSVIYRRSYGQISGQVVGRDGALSL